MWNQKQYTTWQIVNVFGHFFGNNNFSGDMFCHSVLYSQRAIHHLPALQVLWGSRKSCFFKMSWRKNQDTQITYTVQFSVKIWHVGLFITWSSPFLVNYHLQPPQHRASQLLEVGQAHVLHPYQLDGLHRLGREVMSLLPFSYLFMYNQ